MPPGDGFQIVLLCMVWQALHAAEIIETSRGHLRSWAKQLINLNACRFAALRELLPRIEKADRATFLMSSVEYIKQLQVFAVWIVSCR